MKTIILLFIGFLSCFTALAANYYVDSTGGNDANAGTSTGAAWQTMTKVNAKTFTAGDSLYFKRGQVYPGKFRPNTGIKVDWYGSGAMPIIDGLTVLSDWVDLGNGSQAAACPACSKTENLLILDNVPQALARYPNTGWLTLSTYISSTKIKVPGLTGTPSYVGMKMVVRSSPFTLDTVRITAQSIDSLTFTPAVTYTTAGGNGIFFYADRSFLDSYGEWCMNGTNDSVLVYFGSELPASHIIKTSIIDSILSYGGTNININHIEFRGANMFDVILGFSSTGGNKIKNCRINYSGGHGVWLNNEQQVEITYDSFFNCLNNSPTSNGTTYLIDSNNYFENAGMIIGMGAPGANMSYVHVNSAPKGIHRNNYLKNSGYTGMYVSGDSTKVINNDVDGYCSVKDDGGAIYSWDASFQTYTNQREIRNNRIRNGHIAPGGHTLNDSSLSQAIYIDGHAKSILVDGNTCWNNFVGIYNHGSSITFTNNYLYNNYFSQFYNYEVTGTAITGVVFKYNKLVTFNDAQRLSSAVSVSNDLSTYAVVDSNSYYVPKNTIKPFYTFQTGDAGTFREFAGWKTNTTYDANSTFDFWTQPNIRMRGVRLK